MALGRAYSVAVRGLDADVVCHCGELDAERG